MGITTSAVVTMFRRRRVTALIEAMLTHGPVSLLVASPGYGKTRALQEAIGDNPRIHWVELPPVAQIEDVVRGLTKALVPDELASVPQFFSGSGRAKDLERLVEWFTRRLEAFDETVVIDDLHRCNGDAQAMAFLERIIEATSTHVQWILSSRDTPALPIAMWVARGLMATPIANADLAFDLDDAIGLAQARGSTIGTENLRQIIDDADGWPIAVQLALQLWDRKRSVVPTLVRTREMLFAQFKTELWPDIEPQVRRLLMACAILPETQASLLEAAGFADAGEQLDFAYATIPFVQRTAEGRYVLHDLFAEFVREQSCRQPVEVAALQDRLATALLVAGDKASALTVLVSGEHQARILDVLAIAGCELIEQGQRPIVARALEFLADMGRRNEPIIVALRGLLSHLDGDALNAETLYRDAYDRGLPAPMRVAIGCRLCYSYSNTGKDREAVPILEELFRTSDSLALDQRVEVLTSFACLLACAGDNIRAREVMQTILKIDTRQVSLLGSVRIPQRLGFSAFFLGDLREAEHYARQAAQRATDLKIWNCAAQCHSIICSVTSLTEKNSDIALDQARTTYVTAERAGDIGLMAFAVRSEYAIHAYRGDESAFDHAALRLARFRDVHTYRSLPGILIARALAEAIRGKSQLAVGILQTADRQKLTDAENALFDAMLILLYALADCRKESRDLLRQPMDLSIGENFVSRRYFNMARVLRGLAQWMHGDFVGARALLRAKIQSGIAEIDRVLIASITKLCSAPRYLLSDETVGNVLSELHAAGWGGFGRIVEMILGTELLLSPAEIRTIRAFQHGGTIASVARDLERSPHTLECQLKSINKKIGCRNRREALVYMRSIGIIKETSLAPEEEPAHVTPAEIRTLCAFQNGASSAEVARMLGKSVLTVETQLKMAYKKIGCANRHEALAYARAQGWVSGAEPQAERGASRRRTATRTHRRVIPDSAHAEQLTSA